ncbi:DUF6445 family protein [Stakelama sediminis]|uniref:DUF6445 family protein n=1 Tax=Stakelama sediminis TaxID=463200 RepID=UPI0024834495|nr:DUF6445 family protein [Stakelama sediminis]
MTHAGSRQESGTNSKASPPGRSRSDAILPRLHRFGKSRAPVLSVDGLGPPPADIVALAASLAPFPPATNHYPGVRCIIRHQDRTVTAYVEALLEQAAPYIGGAFDIDSFDLKEASFSLVTTPAEALTAIQRAPHFDSIDPDLYAVLHYVRPNAGTAFYRQQATSIELVDQASLNRVVNSARTTPAPHGYINGNRGGYTCIGAVEGLEGRLVAYPARLLHSGRIPPGFIGSDDPARGRLTTNIFIRAHRS